VIVDEKLLVIAAAETLIEVLEAELLAAAEGEDEDSTLDKVEDAVELLGAAESVKLVLVAAADRVELEL
jgi:hypothetical protein